MAVGGSLSVASATLRGIEALPVDVEIATSAGIPGMSIVGMPDGSVLEARARVRCAIKASGFNVSRLRFTVNLSPGELKKSGTGFDLPLAVAMLAVTGQIPTSGLDDCMFVGELALDGSVSAVRGLVAYRKLAERTGKRLVCLASSCDGASEGVLNVERLEDLRRGVRGLQAGGRGERTVTPDGGPKLDYEDVLDQEAAKRALVISAAGRHGLLMVGPPGAGKSMLARRLPTILPPLTPEEAEEVALIGSVAGLSGGGQDNGARPFRAPHHSISQAGMIGGGSPVRPGEVTLAHHGVLFLDELPEFSTNVLQSLRQPFEEHVVRLVRADGLYRFPCDFTFLAAANPCPCGYLGDPAHACTCAPAKVAQYQSRVGGPLKDRIDVHIFVSRPDSRKVVEGTRGMSSAQMRDLVLGAREFRAWRESGLGHEGEEGLESMALGEEAASVLESMARSLGFGGRSIVRVAKVARTIADIRQGEAVSKEDVLEACAYRDRRG